LAADTDREFEEAFERHWLPVFRFAVAWTNDWAAAEDVAQEAFARMWARRAEIDWSSSTLPWLLTTARRLATDRFRRLRRLATLGLGSGSSGSLDADARLRWLDVQAEMAALPPIQRAALVMTTVIGLDADTTAHVLDTTPGGVRAAVSRARAGLGDA
jgi:RNA polymerase sigma-70 factor (ECF subfamily)